MNQTCKYLYGEILRFSISRGKIELRGQMDCECV